MALIEARVAVVGGGIAGLAAAWRLARTLAPEDIVLIEQEPRLGGKIATERSGGFVIESGPDSVLTRKPGAVDLCRELGIAAELVGTLPVARASSVRRAGRLYPLPEGMSGLVPVRLGPLFASSLLSPSGRLRAALDLAIPGRRDDADETIAGFAIRRLGREAYDWLVEPLLGGIFAGDGRALSLLATFPRLHELERTRGGVLRGLARRPSAPVAGLPPFVTPRGGMSRLVEALQARLAGCRILTGTSVQALRPGDECYELRLSGPAVVRARSVILATPAWAAAPLVESFDPALAAELAAIPFVSTATVALAYGRSDLGQQPAGHGYLRPRAEGGPIVACTWTSSKWPDRAPPGQVLLRAFLGRAGEDAVVAASDPELVTLVRTELHQVLGIRAEPRLARVRRFPRGMPQYIVGHLGRVARIEARAARYRGLGFAGHSYHGAGIPDSIRSGERAAAGVERAALVTA